MLYDKFIKRTLLWVCNACADKIDSADFIEKFIYEVAEAHNDDLRCELCPSTPGTFGFFVRLDVAAFTPALLEQIERERVLRKGEAELAVSDSPFTSYPVRGFAR